MIKVDKWEVCVLPIGETPTEDDIPEGFTPLESWYPFALNADSVGWRRSFPCALRALRELGYHWYRIECRDRLESWNFMSRGELHFANVYWNGDGHDVRLIVGYTMVAEESVDFFRGPNERAVKARATAVMAKFREMAERQVVLQSQWQVVRGGGGDAKQRRKARRWAARLMAQARAEALTAKTKETP